MTVRCIFSPTRFTGLATDTKPPANGEQGVNEGSTFYEIDTCKHYVFEQGSWFVRPAAPESEDTCLLRAMVGELAMIKTILSLYSNIEV